MSEFTYCSDSEIGPEILDECTRVAPLVTALFDGEADTEDTRQARRHLLLCARCAGSWQAWERTRYLMHTMPVPAVPVGLLVRILMACRLSALPRRLKRPSEVVRMSESPALRAHDVQIRDAQRAAEMAAGAIMPSYTRDAPLPYDLPEVPVPPHLKDAILLRTVGLGAQQPATAAVAETVVAEPRPRRNRHWDLPAAMRSASFAMPRVSRYGSALAVPAVVAWLMFGAQSPYLMRTADITTVAVPANSAPSTHADTLLRAALHQAGIGQPQRLAALPSLRFQPSAVQTPANPPVVAASHATDTGSLAATAKTAGRPTTELPALTVPSSVAPGLNRNPGQQDQPRFGLASLHSPIPALTAAAPVLLAPSGAKRSRAVASATSRLHSRMSAPQLTSLPVATLASLNWRSGEPAPSAHGAVTADAGPKMRVSPLDPDDFVTTAPAEDAETVAKMREVVDNYRATLVADASDDDSSDDTTDS